MLFNKDWEKPKTQPDPLSLDDLITWLETKDPTQYYNFSNSASCMLAQWVRHLDSGASNVQSDTNSFVYQVNGQVVNFRDTVFRQIALIDKSTFGNALKMAKTYRGRT